MTTTQRLYEAARPVWEACHSHPFVRGIGDGTLELEKFRHFLLQDYLYLFDYARVFAYGVVKARDPDLMRTFAANVDAILGGEMKVHRAYMARLAAIPGAAEHPFYGEWVQSYAGEDYQQTNDALVALMDTLAEGCTEAEYRRLEEIFVTCSRYELGFWDMAWNLER